MLDLAVPVLVAIALWWLSTGVVLIAVRRAPVASAVIGASVVLLVSLSGVWATRSLETPAAAYMAFASALGVWAWVEVLLLTGVLTGPRRTACAPNCSGFKHFRHGVEALLHHELALLGLGLLVAAMTWQAANPVALWAYALLWIMRQSAKLNLFFGVPNLSENLLPVQLAYMASFFKRRPMNWLFPVSITFATALTGWLISGLLIGDHGPYEAAALGLIAALALLGVIEHWLLVLPIPVAALWGVDTTPESVKPAD